MRTILYLSAIVMFAGISVGAQDDEFVLMKGTANPSFVKSDNTGRCLVFGTHIVKTTTSDNGGENISLYAREGTAKGLAACRVRSEPYATFPSTDNNSFYGISTDYFFIDTGTSVDSRTLLIYRTDSGDTVGSVGYYNDPTLVGGRYLVYDDLSSRKGSLANCPEGAKWKRSGGGVGWVQGKKMDLQTKATVNVGTLRCVYLE